MTTSEKRHTMRAVIDRPTDYPHVAVVIGCPWEPDDPDRDCRMVNDDGYLLNGCALHDWLDAAGPEGIAFHATTDEIALPVRGRCERRGHEDWPTFVVVEEDEDDDE